TRELATELGVSRNTVYAAYDMLWTEGFIVNRQGAPSRAADGLQMNPARTAGSAPKQTQTKPDIRWDFKTGQPDLSAFPWKAWNETLKNAADSLSARQFAYSGPKGYEPLCGEIARWLLRARGMEAEPQDVFITSGSTQALYLLVDILHRDGRDFGLENPSHPGIRTVIEDKGYPICFVPVDGQGADVSALDGRELSAAYVTPSHQFPLGGILPASRRAALIRMAAEKDFYIIEDDYDSEFRYAGLPVSPLYAMDSARVIYVGTFSKTLFPALRLGFAVLPKALQAKWRHSRTYMDMQNPILEQAALANFLRTRRMDKHIRRMKRVYGEKRDTLLDAIRAAFGNAAIPWGDASGLHTALQFPGHAFGPPFIGRCADAGIRISPVSQYCASGDEHTDKLLLGYGHLQAEQIREGIVKLLQLIQTTHSH
ncbi:MAG: PLP-dependent aminotransferase family protein, partial [Bacillota bacterium]